MCYCLMKAATDGPRASWQQLKTMRMTRKQIAVLTAAGLLSACATVDVDESAESFDEAIYAGDLAECRGGPASIMVLNGFGGALVGSAFGFVEGAWLGASAGDSAEGAVIGTIVGSVVGLAVGAYDSVSEQDEELARCMRGKGYVLDTAWLPTQSAVVG